MVRGEKICKKKTWEGIYQQRFLDISVWFFFSFLILCEERDIWHSSNGKFDTCKNYSTALANLIRFSCFSEESKSDENISGYIFLSDTNTSESQNNSIFPFYILVFSCDVMYMKWWLESGILILSW